MVLQDGERECCCIVCGCTDSDACDGGCSWIEVDRAAGTGLCSAHGEVEKNYDY